jgi:hypothetical protein
MHKLVCSYEERSLPVTVPFKLFGDTLKRDRLLVENAIRKLNILCDTKVKGKVHLRTGHEGPEGE